MNTDPSRAHLETTARLEAELDRCRAERDALKERLATFVFNRNAYWVLGTTYERVKDALSAANALIAESADEKAGMATQVERLEAERVKLLSSLDTLHESLQGTPEYVAPAPVVSRAVSLIGSLAAQVATLRAERDLLREHLKAPCAECVARAALSQSEPSEP